MNAAQRIAAIALLLVAAGSQAARPTSIVFETHAETDDGKPYSRYTVKCNDGRTVPLTAWEGQRKWCVSTNKGASSCEKQQISAAKMACLET
jgi:hypothetical protein